MVQLSLQRRKIIILIILHHTKLKQPILSVSEMFRWFEC